MIKKASLEKPRGNAAIHYHPEGYNTTNRDNLMGRHAAGEGFLQGFLRHAEVETLFVSAESKQHFRTFMQQAGPALERRLQAVWIPSSQPEQLARPGALYYPGPDIGGRAWQRRFGEETAYSLIGVTHTICTDRIMDALGEFLIAPLQPWDAVICTSRAVREAVDGVLHAYGDYLAERLKAKVRTPQLQLPVIPLGVDCEMFGSPEERARIRTNLRQRFAMAEDDIAVLFMGRLSYHAKAHPLPMYLALERAARETGRKIHLIQAGWFPNDTIKEQFVAGARQFCPSVRAIFVDGRKPAIRRGIWSAADIFCSLSDNIQETFGLSPIEGQAAGLPVVVSDWDGYKDTVKHGDTGFLIPTAMPAAGCGAELALRYYTHADTYDRYIGQSSQCIAVDVPAAAEAFIQLIKNSDLRTRMGQQAASWARSHFNWPVVVAQYQELWGELAERRQLAQKGKKPKTAVHGAPLRGDPFAVFAGYPTQVLNKKTRLSVTIKEPLAAFRHRTSLQMNKFAAALMLPQEECEALIQRITESKAIEFKTVLADFPHERHAALQRTVAWLAKLGIIRIET